MSASNATTLILAWLGVLTVVMPVITTLILKGIGDVKQIQQAIKDKQELVAEEAANSIRTIAATAQDTNAAVKSIATNGTTK